jgi:hypothetical protein
VLRNRSTIASQSLHNRLITASQSLHIHLTIASQSLHNRYTMTSLPLHNHFTRTRTSYSLTHLLTHLLTYSLTHFLTSSLTHSHLLSTLTHFQAKKYPAFHNSAQKSEDITNCLNCQTRQTSAKGEIEIFLRI